MSIFFFICFAGCRAIERVHTHSRRAWKRYTAVYRCAAVHTIIRRTHTHTEEAVENVSETAVT